MLVADAAVAADRELPCRFANIGDFTRRADGQRDGHLCVNTARESFRRIRRVDLVERVTHRPNQTSRRHRRYGLRARRLRHSSGRRGVKRHSRDDAPRRSNEHTDKRERSDREADRRHMNLL